MSWGGALLDWASSGRRRGRDAKREVEPRLIVKTRCVLVADVIAVDANGRQERLAEGLEEGTAREMFEEIMGRPWTSAEITPARAAEGETRPRPVAVESPSEARRRPLRPPRSLRRSSRSEPRENAA